MYYLKEALFLFIYAIIMSFLSLAIELLNVVWLKYFLSIVCILFYLFVMIYDLMQVGQKAAKQLHANDLTRIQIVKTGKDLPIKRAEEYKTYKGFLIGALSCAPMLLFLLIHLIIHIAGGTSLLFGGISSFCYMVYMEPIVISVKDSLSFGQSFIALYGLVVSSVVSGIGYMLGAKKILLQYERIEKKQKMIYGE